MSARDSTSAPREIAAELWARIETECTRVMYRQVPNSFTAAMGVTLYMVITLWRSVPHTWLGGWVLIQALAQAHRFWAWRSYWHRPA